tara:strand:- start:557 stop:787 length:231 start_codon:yes stop_codon:yes gene_type:complete
MGVWFSCPHLLGDNMQYWKKLNSGHVQRLEDSDLEKHPEKLESLQEAGWERVMGEDNFAPYKKSFMKKSKKKKKKK